MDFTWFKQIVTGRDNQTHDIVRWAGVLGTLQALGLSGYDVIMNHVHFDIQQFGIGLGALLGAVGAALGMKANAEPGAK